MKHPAPQEINVVWLKRDLRSRNHACFAAAEAEGIPYLPVYIFDPEIIAHPDTSPRHLRFVYFSILNLNETLNPYGLNVEVFYAGSREVFADLAGQFRIRRVFSYRETGVRLTWERDKEVGRFFESRGVEWREFQKDGILRGVKDRKGWDRQWFATMSEPLIDNRYSTRPEIRLKRRFPLPAKFGESMHPYPAIHQPAGESNAWKYLVSFAERRGFGYHYLISKPTESRFSCSRISVYLAWGNLSIQQAYQFVKNHPNRPRYEKAFGAFLNRLKWHCHFIQKFEVECDYETRCLNRGYESLERTENPDWLAAWREGKTGYPLIDACMRAVVQTGWINFRMRSMLVSFLCHHLDQDWRKGVHHLARQFLDYEPGIHYPQFQMQAGTTGINTIRMYNPVKQSLEHDPKGTFIKKWVGELGRLDSDAVHEPWKLAPPKKTTAEKKDDGKYPPPIVPLEESAKKARDKLWGHQKNEKVQEENRRILKTHAVARKSSVRSKKSIVKIIRKET